MHNPDQAFSLPTARIIKDSHTTSSCFIPLTIKGRQVPIHIKRYNYQNIFYASTYLFRTSRAKRVWTVANELILRGIPTPLPISFLEQRRGGLLIKSFFITQMIDPSLSLHTLLNEHVPDAQNKTIRNKHDLIRSIAHVIRSMHDQGIWHGDLKSANILVEKKEGQNDTLYLVDLDSTRIKTRLEKKDRIRDLARLNASLLDTRIVSTTDRFRFLNHYLHVSKKRNHKARDYWKETLGQTEKKLKQSGKTWIS